MIQRLITRGLLYMGVSGLCVIGTIVWGCLSYTAKMAAQTNRFSTLDSVVQDDKPATTLPTHKLVTWMPSSFGKDDYRELRMEGYRLVSVHQWRDGGIIFTFERSDLPHSADLLLEKR